MRTLHKLNKQELGDAIVDYIGMMREGTRFFPYRIKHSKWTDDGGISVELEFVPKGSFIRDYPHKLGDANEERKE